MNGLICMYLPLALHPTRPSGSSDNPIKVPISLDQVRIFIIADADKSEVEGVDHSQLVLDHCTGCGINVMWFGRWHGKSCSVWCATWQLVQVCMDPVQFITKP